MTFDDQQKQHLISSLSQSLGFRHTDVGRQ